MKPITHPLAIAKLEAEAAAHEASLAESMVKLDSEMATTRAWRNANCPLYADPTPLPAPALGMRVWRVVHDEHDGCRRRTLGGVDISVLTDGPTKTRWTSPETIDLITDYRTGEVLWRRA